MADTAPTISRVFHALNGEEVKEIIVREIRKELNNEESLEEHLAFPVIEWDWQVSIRAYPHSVEEFRLAGRGEINNVQLIEALKKQNATVTLMKGAKKVEMPDQAREEAGLPVPTPTNTSAGVTFDLMETAGGPPRK